MTLREVAEACGVKVRTVREWLKIGRIRGTKSLSGYRWIIAESEVSRIIGERQKDEDKD